MVVRSFLNRPVRGCILALLLLGSVATGNAHAQVSESVVKAAFLFNFAKFTTWPDGKFEDRDGSFVMCVQRGTLSDDALAQFREKSIQGRVIELIEFTDGSSLRRCHLAYISDGLSEMALMEILTQSNQHAILTVSDLTLFARAGGMIGLIIRDGKIQFEVNVEAAQRSSIGFSSKLLSLAKII